MLKYLYSLPLLAEGEEWDPYRLLELYCVAKDFEMPGLCAQIAPLVEPCADKLLVDLETETFKEPRKVDGFFHMLIGMMADAKDGQGTSAITWMAIKLYCRYDQLILTNAQFLDLAAEKRADILRMMHDHVTRPSEGSLASNQNQCIETAYTNFYDSMVLSDVVAKIPRIGPGGFIEVHAHKVVLVAGSNTLRNFFQV